MHDGIPRAVAAALAIVILALALSSVWMDAATSDEPAYLAAGFIKLVHGRLDFFRDQPPLMNSISVIPLLLAGYRLPPVWSARSNHWEVGRYMLYRSGYDAHRILFLQRLPSNAMLIALCFVVFVFVKRYTGSLWWGTAAFALVGFCPNVMAHGRLATVDLALSFFSFCAVALLIVLIERPSLWPALGLGVSSAAAIMTKTSANILGPFFILVLILAFALRRAGSPRRLLAFFGAAILIALIMAECVILGEASPAYITENFPQLSHPAIARLLIPLAEYRANIQAISRWYLSGHEMPQFMLGQFSYTGWRTYYIVAFLLKTTIPAILLVIGALVAIARRLPRRGLKDDQGRFAALVVISFAILFFAVASAGHIDLGIRYVLLIYPFLYAGTMVVMSQAYRDVAPQHRRAFTGVVAALLLWHGGENLAAYPSYISYFNELTGSRRNADRFLIDSNLDWGQDLRRLQVWCLANRVEAITIYYFGGGEVAYEFRNTSIAVTQILEPGTQPLAKGWLALSRHAYRLSFSPDIAPIDYDTLFEKSRARYVTTIGGSINIYRVE